jgi:hypothetical protein
MHHLLAFLIMTTDALFPPISDADSIDSGISRLIRKEFIIRCDKLVQGHWECI